MSSETGRRDDLTDISIIESKKHIEKEEKEGIILSWDRRVSDVLDMCGKFLDKADGNKRKSTIADR